MQIKTFKYHLYPTLAQEKQLVLCLNAARNWYNMCLEDRKVAWELEQRRVTKNDQLRLVKHYTATFRQFKDVHSHIFQVATADCDKAFKAFFRRVTAKQTPGYPRFKGKAHFHSFGFKELGNGFQLDGRRLKISAVGRVSVRWHRPLVGNIKTARICRTAGKWYVCFSCELSDPLPLERTGRQVGIDLNVENLLHDSDDRRVESPKPYRTAQAKLRIAQRSMQRKQKGGKNRRKALLKIQRLHEHIKNARQDLLNKEAHYYTQTYDLIGVEELQIANMVHHKHLSKSILDQGWGFFRQRLVAKAANAGRRLVLVNPAYTSKTCSACGQSFHDLTLSTRWITCECGLSLARDHNAALNILHRALEPVGTPL